MSRESGYYWVKMFSGSYPWVVAYLDNNGKWCIGVESYDESEAKKINPTRILTPDERKEKAKEDAERIARQVINRAIGNLNQH